MFDNIAALDIGTSTIKLVMVKTGLHDFKVTSFAYEDIDFSIASPEEALRDALGRLLAENSLKGYSVITNLPMEKAIIRNITFPFSDVEKIAEAIPFEAGENIPFRLEDLSMDFQSLRSPKPEEGRILLTATHRETIHAFMDVIDDFSVIPERMGLESNALFECYRYFNRIQSESVMQLDIGHNKTIINFIAGNSLVYTRSIPIGTSLIYQSLGDILDVPFHEAKRIFEALHLDLTSIENNTQRDYYRALGVPRPRLKKIFDETSRIVRELIEQIYLTQKSFYLSYDRIEFNRLLLSGGGSNIIGIGQVLGSTLELPIVALPFLEEYTEIRIHTQFPIAFGTVLCALNRKQSYINFLKGEFLPDFVKRSRKIYYLAGFFAVLTLIMLGINFIISTATDSRTSGRYEEIMQEKFRRYFHTRTAGDDPVRQATKILNDQKKDLAALKAVVQTDVKVLDMLKDMLAHFPRDAGFDLKNMVISEKIIRIDGEAANSGVLDDFKNRLQQSRQYDSVVLNTTMKGRNQTGFSMTVKLKIDDSAAPGKAGGR